MMKEKRQLFLKYFNYLYYDISGSYNKNLFLDSILVIFLMSNYSNFYISFVFNNVFKINYEVLFLFSL